MVVLKRIANSHAYFISSLISFYFAEQIRIYLLMRKTLG